MIGCDLPIQFLLVASSRLAYSAEPYCEENFFKFDLWCHDELHRLAGIESRSDSRQTLDFRQPWMSGDEGEASFEERFYGGGVQSFGYGLIDRELTRDLAEVGDDWRLLTTRLVAKGLVDSSALELPPPLSLHVQDYSVNDHPTLPMIDWPLGRVDFQALADAQRPKWR